MRIISALALALCLAACKSSAPPTNEAIRQVILERLKARGMPVDVKIESVKMNAGKADVVVSVVPEGQSGAGMTMPYQLEQKDGKWVVLGAAGAMGAPHPGAENPGGAMPGAMPPAGGAPAGGNMPSPSDLPPSSKKK